MKIVLTLAEQKLAVYIARCRHANNRAAGVPNDRIGPQSDEQTDLEGFGAELAVCKVLNVYPDLETEYGPGGRPPEDLTSRCGCRIDAKSTHWPAGKLLVVVGKAGHPADYYCLVTGKFPVYRIAGLMSAGNLLREERVRDLGHGPTYVAQQCDLTPVEVWLEQHYGAELSHSSKNAPEPGQGRHCIAGGEGSV